MITDKQKLQLIEQIVNNQLKDKNHPKCIDEINNILICNNYKYTTQEFLSDLHMEQMEQM